MPLPRELFRITVAASVAGMFNLRNREAHENRIVTKPFVDRGAGAKDNSKPANLDQRIISINRRHGNIKMHARGDFCRRQEDGLHLDLSNTRTAHSIVRLIV